MNKNSYRKQQQSFYIFATSLVLLFFLSVHAEEIKYNNLYTGDNLKLKINDNYKAEALPKEFNKRCHDNIIRDDGTYGPRGEMLKKEILGIGRARAYTDLFFGDGKNPEMRGLMSQCPGFSKMNDDEKLNFWILVMATTANYESGCNTSARNGKATNGIAIGEYQTPLTENGQSPAWRGPGCSTKGIKSEARVSPYYNPEYQASCAVEILGTTVKGGYHKGKSTFPTEKGSYWEVLMGGRRNYSHTKHIQGFKPCLRYP